jgi:hypothetical protein
MIHGSKLYYSRYERHRVTQKNVRAKFPSFIQTGSSIQKVTGEIHRHTAWRLHKPTFLILRQKFWGTRKLIAYVLSYDTDRTENDAANNSTAARVEV